MGIWARCAALACTAAWAVSAVAETALDRAEPLTGIGDIIRLPRDAAALALPVRVRAVVTAPGLPNDHCFVQSGGDGIAVVAPQGPAPLHRGDLVEIVGVTAAGRFAPNIVSSTPLRAVGRAPLPPVEPLRVTEFVNGSYHGRFLSVTGVVRSAEREPGYGIQVSLATGFGRVRVVLPLHDPATLGAKVGAEVTVRGAFATDLSAVGQLAGIRVHAQDPGDFEVRVPPTALADVPYRVLSDLARYDPSAHALGRVRTRGVATLLRADGALFVQDGDHVALVHTVLPPQVAVGDPVEVVGFAAVSDGMLTIDDAELHPGPTLDALSPHAVADPQELSSLALDGRLIRVRGEAQLATRHSAEVVITTRPDGLDGFLEVRIPAEEARGLVETIRPGSLVECTGVKLPLVSSTLGTRWPVVLARSPLDVVVLRPPAFWTLPRASAAAATLLLLLVAGALVARWREGALRRSAAVLERRVARRTRDLALANGNLLKLDLLRRRFIQLAAHDLRSPLAVVLSNTTHVLSLPGVPAAVRGPCEDVQEAGQRMRDVLGAFLSREDGDSSAVRISTSRIDLARLVAEVPHRLAGVADRKHQWIEASLPPDPAWIDGDLVLVAHVVETLVDNALKFSPPRTVVRVSVHCGDGSARVCVADQGPGLTDQDLSRLFVPGARLSARPTGDEPAWGIGLVLAKAWVEAMKGRIWAERAETGGAAFWLSFPLRDAPAADAAPDGPGVRAAAAAE